MWCVWRDKIIGWDHRDDSFSMALWIGRLSQFHCRVMLVFHYILQRKVSHVTPYHETTRKSVKMIASVLQPIRRMIRRLICCYWMIVAVVRSPLAIFQLFFVAVLLLPLQLVFHHYQQICQQQMTLVIPCYMWTVGIVKIKHDLINWIVWWWKVWCVCWVLTRRLIQVMNNGISDWLVVTLLPFLPGITALASLIDREDSAGL